MPNLKDTDFDDLFRRASDKYPLRTDSADWNRMAAALDKDPTPAEFDGADAEDKRRKKRFFWLLLLLPLGGAGYFALQHAGHGSSHLATVPATVPTTVVTTAPTTPADRHHSAVAPGTPSAANTTDATTATVNAQPVASGATGAIASAQPAAGTTTATQPVAANTTNPRRFSSPIHSANRRSKAAIGSDGGQNLDGGHDQQSYASEPHPIAKTSLINEVPFTLKWAGDMQRVPIARDYQLSIAVTTPPAVRNTEPAKQKKPRASYLYAGILGAPDISTVKMQSVKGMGTTFGVLLGYSFNPHWAIETGVYLDRKKYYTDGEYFSKENLPLYNVDLLNVNGTCYMWELPLNVRYTFNPSAKTKWFATGGLSTYLMSQEDYTYAYLRNGWYGQTNSDLKKPSQYPFSIVNLSGGFEQRLGRVGNLRVEPYVRLPLQGLGTGKLPIMSAGVNIGITRRLW